MVNPLQYRNNASGAREIEIAMDLMVASFAHEIKQPLAAMVANANATKRWLSHTPPNIEEANASLDSIANEGHRASEVINSIRSMYKKGTHGQSWSRLSEQNLRVDKWRVCRVRLPSGGAAG